MSIAAKVAMNKQKHPKLYCPAKNCLWRTEDGSYCPRHEYLKESAMTMVARQKNLQENK